MSRHVTNCYTPEHPCERCGHAISRYRWEQGYEVCFGCEDAAAVPGPANGNERRVLTSATDERHIRDRKRKARKRLKERGEMPAHRMSDERQAEVLRLHAEGKAVGAIGRALGCGDGTVKRVLTEHGLTPNRLKHGPSIKVGKGFLKPETPAPEPETEPHISKELAEELAAKVDEEFREEDEKPTPEPNRSFPSTRDGSATLTIRMVCEDPALEALKRLADSVYGDYKDSDFVSVAYELGLARGAKEALERACLAD